MWAFLRRWPLAVGVCSLLALLLYANSLSNGHVLDDRVIIERHPLVLEHQWRAIWQSPYWPAMGREPDTLYRPLTIASYALQHYLAPQAIWQIHLVNVLLHGLVTALVAMLAWRLFGQLAIVWITGLLFAVHPIHTEAVANGVGRAELLASAGSLAAILVLTKTGEPRWRRSMLAAFFWLFALVSKETPAVLLPGLVLVDYVLGRQEARWWPGKPWFLGRLPLYLPLLATFVFYLFLRVSAVGWKTVSALTHPVVNPLFGASLWERILTPFAILARYLALTAWPRILIADYSAPSVMPSHSLLDPWVLAGLASLIALIATLIWAWRRAPALAAVIILLGCHYLVISNVVRIGTIMGERLIYAPSIFLFLLLGWALHRLWPAIEAPAVRRLVLAAGLSALVAMSLRTLQRNRDWHDLVSLALATARDNSQSAQACYWAGSLILEQPPESLGTQLKEAQQVAVTLLHRAITLYPLMGEPYLDLGLFEARQVRYSSALGYLSQAATRLGGDTRMRLTLHRTETWIPPSVARECLVAFEKERKNRPGDAALDFACGLASQSAGDFPRARAFYYQAMVDQGGSFHEAAAQMAKVAQAQGQAQEACQILRTYVRQNPYNSVARGELVEALLTLPTTPEILAEARGHLQAGLRFLQFDSYLSQLRKRREFSSDGNQAGGNP